MRTRVIILVSGCLLAAVGGAATAMVKPDAAIHYRQGVYSMIGWNFSPLVQMVKGKTPWDAAEFTRRADRIAALAPQALEGFPPGSDTGAKTSAKPAIWTKYDDFKTKMDDFVTQSKRLAEVSKGGDEAKTREQFKTTAGTCKACHDEYRDDD